MKLKRFSIITILAVAFAVASSFSATAQNRWALVKTAVTSLRTEPRHAAEMSTQAIMGTPIRLLEKSGDWWKVQLPDEYTGYVPANTITTLTQSEFDKWRLSDRRIVDTLESQLTGNGRPVSDLMMSNILTADSLGNLFTPDGRSGQSPHTSQFTGQAVFDADKIIRTALSMLGRVYLWGGTSPKMTDCSGLVKVCFLSCGIILRRDASQQAQTGKLIADISQARKGDLLFFGTKSGRVNHVGIYLGDNKYVHCSGQVKINSLDTKSPDFIPNRLLSIRRIDGMIGSDGIWSIGEHPWYFLKR